MISRYSAHHWHDVGQALREVKRVLKPGGIFIIMDVMSPGHPVRNIWLQTVEALRDTSHVQNYSSGEWLTFITEAGLISRSLITDRLPLEFASWIARMRTRGINSGDPIVPESASADVKAYFELHDDGSFTSDTIMAEAQKQDKQKRHRGESVPFNKRTYYQESGVALFSQTTSAGRRVAGCQYRCSSASHL